MSVFRDRSIACPKCGEREERYLAISLNAPRAAKVRQAILDGEFQNFTCAKCATRFCVDGPLVWLDFPNKRWLMVFPSAWEASWRALELDPVQSHQEAMVDFAPEMVQAQSGGYTIRTLFGFSQLRDKLRALEAGLDDQALEVLKLDAMRQGNGIALHPTERLELVSAGDTLVLAVAGDPTRRIEVPRARLDEIAADHAPWNAAFAAVTGGPYVDVGRMLIAGDAPRPAAASL
jgi:hypothetical protein